MNGILKEINDWFLSQQAPNSSRKYHKCPVCSATWWDDGALFGVERHNFDCWVPRMQNAAKETFIKVVDKGKAEPHFVFDELE